MGNTSIILLSRRFQISPSVKSEFNVPSQRSLPGRPPTPYGDQGDG
jgi:hypothetical protein